MSKYIITIDTGTTNTRIILWDSEWHQLATEKRNVGVRNTAIDGNNNSLKKTVKDCIELLIHNNEIKENDAIHIYASGMITSKMGLVDIPHITMPVSVEDLANATKPIILSDVSKYPIWFIPGLKNTKKDIALDNYESMDIMRGEEVESAAIIEYCHTASPMLIVLPGSHDKFVKIDEYGKITGCLTTITGELLELITKSTIIADAVDHNFVSKENYNREMILEGYQNAKNVGIGRACFSARILNLFANMEKKNIANYILGVVLQSDIQAIQHSTAIRINKNTKVIISGWAPTQQAILDILEYDHIFNEVKTYTPPNGVPLSALGAYIISKKIEAKTLD